MAHAGVRSEVVLFEFIDHKDWLGWVQALGIIVFTELFPLDERRKFPPFQKEKRY